MTTFSGAKVLLTGASSGIGEALAVELAKRGAKLVLLARREAELERVRKLCARPDDHAVEPVDLSDADKLVAKGKELLAKHGPFDLVIHNAGITQRAFVHETELAIDRKLLEVNFFAPVALTRALLPSMLERKKGHIVVVSSVAGYVGTRRRSAYSGSKHALRGWFDALRAEVFDQGLHVTIVCPGYVRTPISENAIGADGARHGVMDAGQANGMSPEECARRILRGVEKQQSELTMGGKETLIIPLKRFLPGLTERIIRKVNT
ncbi:MAG: SDR family oxidoreductase [Deltaproteobacteria bacterium]|nr:SDR family oxidoreductase [Deltaproteobacteria bacterium]